MSAIPEGDDLLLFEKTRLVHLSAYLVFSSLLSNSVRMFCASWLSNACSRFSCFLRFLLFSVDFSFLKIPDITFIQIFKI